MKQRKLILAPVILALLLSGCGLLDDFKAGWGVGKPLIQAAADQKLITQERADAAKRDVDEGLDKASIADKCDDISSDVTDNARKVAKGRCYFTLAKDLRVILARHNLGGTATLDRFVGLADALIAALEGYYHQVTNAAQGIVASGVDPDKELQRKIEELKVKLKAIQ